MVRVYFLSSFLHFKQIFVFPYLQMFSWMERFIYQFLQIHIFNFAYQDPDTNQPLLLKVTYRIVQPLKTKKLLFNSESQLQSGTKTILTQLHKFLHYVTMLFVNLRTLKNLVATNGIYGSLNKKKKKN